jgi:hypothetical protein
MKINSLLQDEKFNYFFSLILGIGLICVIRPMCSGKECATLKPPMEKDFGQYVYRLAEKCYEFKTNVVKCPATGAIEAFRSCSSSFDTFSRRISPIPNK